MEHVILVLEWWVWGLFAVVLFALEVLVAGFVFLGFALGAALVAILLLLGWVGGNIAALILVFALASLATWYVMRRAFGLRKSQVKVWDKDINDDV